MIGTILKDVIDCHAEASIRRDSNVFFITSTIIRMIAFSANETKHIKRTDMLGRYQKFLKFYLFSNETNINCDFATFCGRLSFGLHFCGLDPQDVVDTFPQLESIIAAEEINETTAMMQQIKELHESMEQVHIKNEFLTLNLQAITKELHQYQQNHNNSMPGTTKESTIGCKRTNSEVADLYRNSALIDFPLSLIQTLQNKPAGNQIVVYVIHVLSKIGIFMMPTNINEKPSFFQCIESNKYIKQSKQCINMLFDLNRNGKSVFTYDNGFPNYYDDSTLRSIEQILKDEAHESYDTNVLQFVIFSISHLYGLNVVLFNFENGKIKKDLAYLQFNKDKHDFKDNKSVFILSYKKEDRKVYQMFTPVKAQDDLFSDPFAEETFVNSIIEF